MAEQKYAARALMLTKPESIYGVDSVPVPGSDAMLVRDLSYTPMVTSLYKRAHVRPHFGNAGQMVTDYHSTCDYTIELCTGASVGARPAHSEILRMCALGETIVEDEYVMYTPINKALVSASQYYYLDGLLHKMKGVRGSGEIMFETGKPVEMKVSTKGLFGGQEDINMDALPDANFNAWRKCLPINRQNTPVSKLGGVNIVFSKFSCNSNAKVEYVNRPGRESIDCVGSESTGSITFETTRKGYKDWLEIVKENQMVALEIQHGVDDGNIITFDAARCYLTNPKYSEEKGTSMMTCDIDFSTGMAGVQDDWVLKLK